MWGFPVELLEFPDENGEYKSDIPVSQKLIIED